MGISAYRHAELGLDTSNTKQYFEKTWEPFGVWASFVNNTN